MPRLRSESIGAGDQSWLASTHAIWDGRTSKPASGAFQASNYPGGHVPSGTPVYTTDGGLSVTDSDGGSAVHFGFLYTDQALPVDGGVPVVWHGAVKLSHPVLADFDADDGSTQFTYIGSGD